MIPKPPAHFFRRRSSTLQLLDKRRVPHSFNDQRAATPVMLSTSFSDLPAELIIQVFHSVDDFSTAAALSSVSRSLFSIWKQDLPSFCKTLLPHTIDCFDQAKDLVEAQSQSTHNQQSSDANEAAIGRAKLFFANARIARLASHHYERSAIYKGLLNGLGMTKAERTSFVKAWYRFITIATLGCDFQPLPYRILTSMDFLQFLQMMEVLLWLGCYQDKKHEALRPYVTLSSRQQIALFILKKHLCKRSFNRRVCQTSSTRFYTYTLHDHYPKYIYVGMGVGLAQMFLGIPTDILEGILQGTVYPP